MRTLLAVLVIAACGSASPPVAPAPSEPPPAAANVEPEPDDAGWTGSSYDCLTLMDGQVMTLHLPEATATPVVTMTGAPMVASSVSSLARLGNELFGCDSDVGLHSIDLTTGFTFALGTACTAVADFRGALVVHDLWSQTTSLVTPGSTSPPLLIGLAPRASRVAVLDNKLYAAWHSTSEILVFSLDPVGELGVLPLTGFDSWVEGMAPMSDGRLIINSAWPEEKILVFDLGTGEIVGTVPWLNRHAPPHGLLCEIRT